MSSPTVSVVLIFHNDERFLAEAIDSVFAQTFTDWELILTDDGSTDGSSAIAHRVAAQRPERVRYVDHDGHANRGISATRNLGLSRARGRYVALLDSDDVWEPEKLTDQVAILDAGPDIGLVVGTSLYWWSWAGPDAPRADELEPVGAAPDRAHPPLSLIPVLYPLGRGVAPCPSSCMIRRDLLHRVGGFEERFPGMYEDQAYLVKLYEASHVWVSSRCWDRYRRHPAQMMAVTDRGEYHTVRHDYLRWYAGRLERGAPHDRPIDRALRRALWPYRHPKLAGVRRAAGRWRARVRAWNRAAQSWRRA